MEVDDIINQAQACAYFSSPEFDRVIEVLGDMPQVEFFKALVTHDYITAYVTNTRNIGRQVDSGSTLKDLSELGQKIETWLHSIAPPSQLVSSVEKM